MSYTPMGSHRASDDAGYVRPSREEPRIVWVLVLLPILQVVQFPWGSLTLLPTFAIAVLIAAIGVPVAVADQRVIVGNGHVRHTSPALGILPTLYLAVRGSRRFDETGRGMTPFWVGLAIVIVTVFLLFWGPEGILALLL